MKELREFLEECKHNQNVNFEKGLENRIDLDYVIERLESIKEYNICYNIDIVDYVEVYIESDLCYDSIRKEDKDFLESLTEEDIKSIADKVRVDDGISEEINNSINYYVWHYKKENTTNKGDGEDE